MQNRLNLCCSIVCSYLLYCSFILVSFLYASSFIIQGGPAGAERLHRSRILKKLLNLQMQAGRMYGGVCSALKVLQQQGLLEVKF
jgi:hypothetical protein